MTERYDLRTIPEDAQRRQQHSERRVFQITATHTISAMIEMMAPA
jgi:hypothetical protein